MSTAVRVLKPQWYLVSSSTCDFQIEGDRVECYFAESADEPSGAPDKNRAGTQAVKTLRGGQVYAFHQVDGLRLWAYPKDNGALVIVDDRGGFPIAQQITYGMLTAFSELKVAQYDPVGAWTFPYNINTRLVRTETENGGAVSQDGSFAVINTGTAADGAASIRSRTPIRYQPGVGGLVRFTAIFTEGQPDSEQLVGLGDELDGLFFGFKGESFGVVRRNNGVDEFTAQADWNELPFDELDPTKLNVYQIQYQWLGAGEIRFYVEVPGFGGFVLMHRIKYANTETDVSIQNPSLPLIAMVKNDGNTTDLEVRTPSGSSGLEGDSLNRSQRALYGSDAVEDDVTTEVPILSIRNPDTYQGSANRLSLRIEFVKVTAISNAGNRIGRFRIYEDATLTGASFTAIDADTTPAERDVSATAVSGGIGIASTAIAANQNDTLNFGATFPFLVPPGTTVTITAQANAAIDVGVSITFDSEV